MMVYSCSDEGWKEDTECSDAEGGAASIKEPIQALGSFKPMIIWRGTTLASGVFCSVKLLICGTNVERQRVWYLDALVQMSQHFVFSGIAK